MTPERRAEIVAWLRKRADFMADGWSETAARMFREAADEIEVHGTQERPDERE